MERRGFLAAILAAGVAPAYIGSSILMPVKKLYVPKLWDIQPMPYQGNLNDIALLHARDIEKMLWHAMNYSMDQKQFMRIIRYERRS